MNNRILKFRIWDILAREWMIKTYTTSNRVPVYKNSLGSVTLDFAIDNPDKFVVQQFTGLLDKNNVEIYEGDLLKIEGRIMGETFLPAWNLIVSSYESSATWLAQVIWDNPYASFLLKYLEHPEYDGRGNFSGSVVGNIPWSEVIGNILENP